MNEAFQLVAVLTCTLFAGAAIYIKKLLNPQLDRASDTTRVLLQKWGSLHAIRSILSLAAAIIFLMAIL